MHSTLIISGMIVIILMGYLFFSYWRVKNIPVTEKSDKIKDLTDKNFQHQVRDNLSLVDFWASWCVPCKMMAPVLNELAEEIGPDVQVCKVDVEQYQSLASKYGIKGIPTMLLLRNGQEINRFVGVKSKDFLIAQINRAI